MSHLVVPAVIEDALLAAARRHLPAAVLGGPGLTAAVIDRSRRYTSERARLATPARPDADLAARALFFTVADAGKLPAVLAELTAARAPAGFLSGPTVRVLDLGAGCGAMTLGLVTALAARGFTGRVEVTLVDRDRGALAIAGDAIAAVAAALGVACRSTIEVGDAAAPRPGGFDLVVAGTVLNELDAAAAAAVLDGMVAALAPAGVAIAIEPALRATSRALHALRDRAIAGGAVAVLAPCTRRAAPCPALADERDWCHDHRPLTLPPRAHTLATVTGLRDGDAKWSFLALARAAAAPPPLDGYRIVDDPRAGKGKHELVGCGADGWVAIRLLRRHRTEANRAIERARRGELYAIARPPEGGALDLGPDDRVSPRA